MNASVTTIIVNRTADLPARVPVTITTDVGAPGTVESDNCTLVRANATDGTIEMECLATDPKAIVTFKHSKRPAPLRDVNLNAAFLCLSGTETQPTRRHTHPCHKHPAASTACDPEGASFESPEMGFQVRDYSLAVEQQLYAYDVCRADDKEDVTVNVEFGWKSGLDSNQVPTYADVKASDARCGNATEVSGSSGKAKFTCKMPVGTRTVAFSIIQDGGERFWGAAQGCTCRCRCFWPLSLPRSLLHTHLHALVALNVSSPLFHTPN